MFYSFAVLYQLILCNFFNRGLSLYLFDENIIDQWFSRYLLFRRWCKLICFDKNRDKCCEHVVQLYMLNILFILFTIFSSFFKVLLINQNKLKTIYCFCQVYCECVWMCYFPFFFLLPHKGGRTLDWSPACKTDWADFTHWMPCLPSNLMEENQP